MSTNPNTFTTEDGVTFSVEVITPETAARWLALDVNVDNRTPRPTKIRRYMKDMMDGHWLMTGDPIRFDVNGNLFDGQHRLMSQVRTQTTVRALVIRNLPTEVRDVIDQGATRSAGDVLKFNGTKSHARNLASVLRLRATWEAGMMKTAGSEQTVEATNSTVLDLQKTYPESSDHLTWAMRASKDSGFTPTVLAVARNLMDQVADPEDVEEFWDGVIYSARPGADPRYTLRKWGQKKNSRPNGSSNNSFQMFGILRTWNAWRKGERLTAIQPVTKTAKYNAAGDLLSPTVFAKMPKVEG